MSNITVLGLGPMGRALAAALAAADQQITVWNRTVEKASAFAREHPGVSATATAAQAVAASGLTIACLRDAAAVDAVVGDVGTGWRGRTLVNVTSGTPAQARATAALAAAHGARYLDGAILTPTITIGSPSAVVLYDGPEATFAAQREILAAIGGVPSYLGPAHGRAAAHEIALLALFVTTVHGLAQAFALARAEGVEPTAVAPYAQGMAAMLPEMATRFAGQLEAGAFPGERSTIGSLAATLRHVVQTAEAHDVDAAVLHAVRATVQRAVAAGHAEDGLARLAAHLGATLTAQQT